MDSLKTKLGGGGVSVDWISGVWAEKQGMELKQEAYNPDTFRFFKC